MPYVEQVKQARTPQEAMLIIAHGIDAVLAEVRKQPADNYLSWGVWDTQVASSQPVSQIQGGNQLINVADVSEDERVITIAGPSDEKRAARKLFAEQSLRLEKVYEGAPEDFESWGDVYAAGGPLWLYNHNRDLVMSYPVDVRARMVADVEEDDPQTAQEMGRDILKFPGETGPGGTGMMVADQ